LIARARTLVWVGLVFLIGCGPDYQFHHAEKQEKAGQFYKAWESYQEFAAKHPQHALAPQALFHAGLLSQKKFEDCFMAATFYDQVTSRYPQSEPWARWAALQKNNCPDYFPLFPGSSWIEVDSDTHGQNARIETACEAIDQGPKALPSQAGRLVRSYYGGTKKFDTRRFIYKKQDSQLLELKEDNDLLPQILLKWPLEIGTRWSSRRDKRIINFEIAALSRSVTVAAGDFHDCLLVKSFADGDNSAQYDYYAPNVGLVLRSVVSKAGEKRIIELQSYKIAEPVVEKAQ